MGIQYFSSPNVSWKASLTSCYNLQCLSSNFGQSWVHTYLAVTQVLHTLQCSPMLNLQSCHIPRQAFLFLTGLPEPSLDEFWCIPQCTVHKIWLHVAIGLPVHIYPIIQLNLHNSFNIQYYLIVPSSFLFTFTCSKSSN